HSSSRRISSSTTKILVPAFSVVENSGPLDRKCRLRYHHAAIGVARRPRYGMTRKSRTWCCLALLAFLPGCLHAPFRAADVELPARGQDKANTQAGPEKWFYSTAVGQEDSQRILTKMPHNPDRDQRVM